MKLFSQIIKTAVNVASLPVAIVKDAATFGGAATDRRESYTSELLNVIKEDSEEEELKIDEQ